MLERMEGKMETVEKIVGDVRCGYSIHGLFPWSSYPRAASHVSGSRRAKTPCVYDKRKGKPFSLLNEGLVNSLCYACDGTRNTKSLVDMPKLEHGLYRYPVPNAEAQQINAVDQGPRRPGMELQVQQPN